MSECSWYKNIYETFFVFVCVCGQMCVVKHKPRVCAVHWNACVVYG